jgi:hypothetical protein
MWRCHGCKAVGLYDLPFIIYDLLLIVSEKAFLNSRFYEAVNRG